MNKEELISFLEGKLTELSNEEKEYLKEELRAFKVKNCYDDILKLVDSNKKFKANKHNIFSFFLLGISPKPKHLNHHWELADMADIDCLHEKTAILMADYSIKQLKDVRVGDLVIDSFSNPRRVLNWTDRKSVV
jgi:hypothetical protein